MRVVTRTCCWSRFWSLGFFACFVSKNKRERHRALSNEERDIGKTHHACLSIRLMNTHKTREHQRRDEETLKEVLEDVKTPLSSPKFLYFFVFFFFCEPERDDEEEESI